MYEQMSFPDMLVAVPCDVVVPHPSIKNTYLVRCPDCNQIREIKRTMASKYRNHGVPLCGPCGLRKPILSTAECIVIDTHFHKVGNRWLALIKCPMCKCIFERPNVKVRKQQATYCERCCHILQRTTLPESQNCIIVKPFFYLKGHHTYARVECPICHKPFDKTRYAIRSDEHTICLPCSRIINARYGPRNHRWKGGYDGYYGVIWPVIAETVRDRDGHHCQYPGCAITKNDLGRAIDVHHIIPYSDLQDNRLCNLISLCPVHHTWADSDLMASQSLLDGILMLMYGPDYC